MLYSFYLPLGRRWYQRFSRTRSRLSRYRTLIWHFRRGRSRRHRTHAFRSTRRRRRSPPFTLHLQCNQTQPHLGLHLQRPRHPTGHGNVPPSRLTPPSHDGRRNDGLLERKRRDEQSRVEVVEKTKGQPHAWRESYRRDYVE